MSTNRLLSSLRVYVELIGGKAKPLIIQRDVSKVSKNTKAIDYSKRKQILINVSEEEKTIHERYVKKFQTLLEYIILHLLIYLLIITTYCFCGKTTKNKIKKS